MIQIVAVDKNWAIGSRNKLLYDIPEDMAHFARTTSGKTVIMGERTFYSLPSGALPNRRNIVLTLDKNFSAPNVEVLYSVHELLELVSDIPKDEIFVIGGAQIYKLLLEFCDTCLVTKVEAQTQGADAFYPNLDEDVGWVLTEQSEIHENDGLKYSFCKYITRTAENR